MRQRPKLPEGHGEVLTTPTYSEWASIAASGSQAAAAWDVDVDGEPLARLRIRARREAVASAREYCARFDIEVAPEQGEYPLLVMTGHQPVMFHPGIWIKNFLVDRCAEELTESGTPALGLNLIVDSDAFDSVTLVAPCLGTEVRRCVQYLAVGTKDGCFACAPVPSDAQIADFCEGGRGMLATLPAPAIGRHFDDYCSALRATAPEVASLGELLAVARRRYEAPARTRYLELPVTWLARTSMFARFVRHIAAHASAFREAYNAELAAFRADNQVRSAAQPFPDLGSIEGFVELPLWALDDGARSTLWARSASGELHVRNEGGGFDPLDPGCALAPKALALTLFSRLFLADLFVHGVGGGRYDRVTDGVISRFFGVAPPLFAVASMTMYLPLGGHAVSDEELAVARRRLNRIEHNPDAMLSEVEFDSSEQHDRATALAQEKSDLVERIKQPAEDKKSLGARIRQINAELGDLLEPFAAQVRMELEGLESSAASADVFTDRTYPFCLWNPLEVQDKAR